MRTTGPLIALAVAALTACSSDAPIAITPPQPTGAAERACTALSEQLPATVDGSGTSHTSPESPFTAAWGDIVLVCGGAAPVIEPTAQLVTVDEVDWFPERLPQGGTKFSTVKRAATVTVTVPLGHEPEAGALVDISGSVRATVPSTATTPPAR